MAIDKESYGHGYEVHVYTGFRSNANTKSKVQMMFVGTESKSDNLDLNNEHHKKVS